MCVWVCVYIYICICIQYTYICMDISYLLLLFYCQLWAWLVPFSVASFASFGACSGFGLTICCNQSVYLHCKFIGWFLHGINFQLVSIF